MRPLFRDISSACGERETSCSSTCAGPAIQHRSNAEATKQRSVFCPEAATQRHAARTCLSSLDADPRFYTHHYSMADLRDVLQQLGYAQVNLWGGSWGTRSALVFSAAFPDLVRRVVLDGAVAVTMDFPWSYPTDAARALDRLISDCAEGSRVSRGLSIAARGDQPMARRPRATARGRDRPPPALGGTHETRARSTSRD